MENIKFVIEKSARIDKLVNALYEKMPEIESARGLLVTESYKASENLPVILRRRAAFAHILRNIPIVIRDNELVVGSATVAPRGCQVFPEYSYEWLEAEFDTVATRDADPFYISEKTKAELHDAYSYWKGKTCSDLAKSNMAPAAYEAFTVHGMFNPDGSKPTMDERIEMVFDVIEGHDPDVIGLTEINYLWLPYLEENVTSEGGKYAAYGRSGQGSTYGSGRYSGQKWDLFNLILWRTDKYELVESGSFWGSRTPDRVNTCNWPNGLTGDMGRAMNWVILKDKATGLEFFFLCGHLDAKTDEVRTLSAELIRNRALDIAEGRPIILVGDWNANERRPAYGELTKDGLDDARYLTADYEDMNIYNTYNKWGEYTDEYTTRPPIDHCFVSTANVFVDSALMDQAIIDEAKTMYASDHNATIFSLRLLLPKTEEETEAPTDGDTEEITTPVTETTTEPPTDAVTDPVTEAPTAEPTQPAKGGCGSVVSLSVMALLPAVAVALSKKKKF